MLLSLHIENFALISMLDVNFGHGLNIITGETGAGKSIIVDALLSALGERMTIDTIRRGAQKSIVEAVFSIEGNTAVRTFLEENQFDCHENYLIVRREMTAKGISRSFINDSPSNLTLTKALGDLLADFHGQHEHQSLLKRSMHLNLLDNVGGLEGILSDYRTSFANLKSLLQDFSNLLFREKQLKEQEELKRFQFGEIQEVEPLPDEENLLKTELSIIEHAESLHTDTEQLYSILYEEENSIRDRLVKVRNILDRLTNIDASFAEYRAECQSSLIIVEEIAKFAQSYNSRIEFQPERIEFIRHRLVALARLRKKYGTFDEIFRFFDLLRNELALTENFEQELERLYAKIHEGQQKMGKIARRLSTKRQTISKQIEKSIIATLKNLGIPNAQFSVHFENTQAENTGIEKDEFGQFIIPKNHHETLIAEIEGQKFCAYSDGIDKIEFYIAMNIGEELKPLAKVASGGEISRVMLALKTILAQSDRLPMLVFDEIDTGISGRIGQKVGIAMKNLSNYHQIISITHLPQIAALADTHICVKKSETKQETTITALVLSEEDHIREVAKLLSGEEITQASLESARELTKAGEK